MLKRKHIQEILTLFICIQSFGLIANCVITGRIIDSKDKSPIEYASIWIGKNGGFSDKNGVFTINIPDIKISDTLKINYIGYRITGYTGICCQNDTIVLDSIPLFYITKPFYDINEKPPSSTEGIAEYKFIFNNKYHKPQLFPKGKNIILYNFSDK